MPEITTLGAVIKSTYEGEPNTNAFTDAEKSKLAGIQTGAEVNTVDSVNGQTGDVQIDVPTALSELDNDTNFITSAQAPVQSVAGKTGTVTLVKGDVGLSNVDNTSDVNKPVSTAMQAALDEKISSIEDVGTGQMVVVNMVVMTQEDYDDLPVKNVNTVYGTI